MKYRHLHIFIFEYQFRTLNVTNRFYMEEIDFIYAAGKRVNSVLVYTTSDKYLFKKRRSGKDVVKHYECYTDGCKVKIKIQNGVCMRTVNDETHSHPDHKEMYDQFQSEYSMKTRSQSNPDVSIRMIVSDEVGIASESPDSPYRRLRSSLYYNQKKDCYIESKNISGNKALRSRSVCQFFTFENERRKQMYHNIFSNDDTVYILLAAKDVLDNLPESSRVVPPNSSFKLLLTISIIKVKEVSSFPHTNSCFYLSDSLQDNLRNFNYFFRHSHAFSF